MIRLSEKHGVNPAVPICFFCGESKNMLILAGKLKGDVEAPSGAVWDKEPCEKCAGYMEMGIILISVDEGLTADETNPFRTGGWVVLKEEAVSRIFGDEAPKILERRAAFIPDTVWDAVGLPRPDVNDLGEPS